MRIRESTAHCVLGRSLSSALLVLLCGGGLLGGACDGSERSPRGAGGTPDLSKLPGDYRPRVLVTTDGEIDDRCSMIRFLLYANEWDIEGIVYSSSRFHWKGHRWAGTQWIQEQIDAYAEVWPNLRQHDPSYPSPEFLRARVSVGNVDRRGEMAGDTPGSDRIVEVLLDDEPGPVYLQAWGGTNTIARALRKIQQEHPAQVERVSRKAIVYIILDQDETFRAYIQPSWPDLQVLASFEQFRAIAYKWRRRMPGRVRKFFRKDWMRKNILHGHGPLASAYPTGRFVSEGDSPAFLHQVQTGLGSLAHPSYGGWGGRFGRESDEGNVWRGVWDDGNLSKPIWRWAEHFQNDWAARADWCVMPYDEANHPPRAVVNQVGGRSILWIEARPGSTVALSAAGSSDPDGDELSYEWWQYLDAGTCKETLEIRDARRQTARIELPEGAEGCELHVILTVRDDGSPNLVAYRRVVLDVARPGLLRRLW